MRAVSVTDELVARDVSAYVQMVLVPELATRLVMEDKGVDEERARDVMEESTALGMLVQREDYDASKWEATQSERVIS